MANIYWSATFDSTPRVNWERTQSKRDGPVEWMRFIWGINSLLKEVDNLPRDVDMSNYGGFGLPRLSKSVEYYPSWTVYINSPESHKTTIVLHTKQLLWAAERVYKEVQESYNIGLEVEKS